MPRGRPVPKGPDDHRFFVLPAGPPQDAKTMRARRHGAGLQNIARNRAVRQPAASPASRRWRSGEIGRAHSELQSLMRISYAVFCLKKKKTKTQKRNRTYTTKTMNYHNNNRAAMSETHRAC